MDYGSVDEVVLGTFGKQDLAKTFMGKPRTSFFRRVQSPIWDAAHPNKNDARKTH